MTARVYPRVAPKQGGAFARVVAAVRCNFLREANSAIVASSPRRIALAAAVVMVVGVAGIVEGGSAPEDIVGEFLLLAETSQTSSCMG